MKRETKFDIALSFAGEDRAYVDKVATLLKYKRISVFYDLLEEANLWGKNLYDYLSDIYQNQAQYTIMFISEYYNKKLWTNHEREAMQARAFRDSAEYILPVRFDNTKIPGVLSTTGYIDLNNKTPEQLASLIEKKLIINGETIPSVNLRKSLFEVHKISRSELKTTIVTVSDKEGNKIADAQVILIADNGTYLEASTNVIGEYSFTIKTRRLNTVIVAHYGYPSAIIDKYDSESDLRITLYKTENIGSIIIQNTGNIPGLMGRLEPILDSENRMYLYADNISVEDEKTQPVTFKLDELVGVEDSQGNFMNLVFRFVNGVGITLIDYIKPIYE